VILTHLIILSVQLCIDVQDDTVVTEKILALKLQSQKVIEFKILGGIPGCNAQIQKVTTTVEAGTMSVTLEEVVMQRCELNSHKTVATTPQQCRRL